MTYFPIGLPQQDTGDACWSFLQSKKVLLSARGYHCSVSCHRDQRTEGRRFCLSWVPSTELPHPSVSRRASRNYVLELTLCASGTLLFSYSGCGIDTQQAQRAITVGPALERDLDALFLEFEVTSRFIHHDWFVMPPKAPMDGVGERPMPSGR